MAVVARGNVADRPFAATFFAVVAKRFTGELVLTEGGRPYRLAFDGGMVVGAASPAPADSVARIAVTSGLVTSTQVAELLRLSAADPARDQIDILAVLAGLETDHLARLRASCFAYRAMRPFALSKASFELVTESQTPREPAAIDPRWVLFHGIKTHYSEERLAQDLNSMSMLSATLRLTEAGAAALPAFGLDETEAAVATVLASYSASLEMLGDKYGSLGTKNLHSMIHALGACGYLKLTPGQANAVRQPATPANAAPPPRPQAATTPPPRPQAATTPPPATAPAAATPTPAPTPLPRSRRESIPRPTQTPTPAGGTAPPGPPADGVADGGDLVHQPRGFQIKRRKVAASPEETAKLILAKLKLIDGGGDHFQLLDITRGASGQELRSAYFTLAKQLHPDSLRAIGIDDSTADVHRLFAQINEAFNTLASPVRRDEYLRILAAGGIDAVRAQERAAEAKTRAIFEAEEQFQVGEMALRRNQYAIAADAFKKALELNAEEGEHHAFLGWALWCSTTDKAAVEKRVEALFDRGLELSPKSIDATFYRAEFAKQREGRDNAEAWFEKVLKLRPDHAEATLELNLMRSRKNSPADSKGGGLFSRLKR